MDQKFIITERDKALATMQKIELEGLQEIDRICRKHDIKYSLGGGTCLGQVRHGGFIPWDDDIDVDMTVDNYDRFMDVVLDELDTSRFFLRCRKTDPTHLRSASRLEILDTKLSMPRWDEAGKSGRIFVDIFRWNYLPNETSKRKKIASRLFFIHCMQTYKEFHKFAAMLDQKYHFLLMVLSTIIPKNLLIKIEDHYVHYCKDKTDWIIDDAIIHGDHGGYPAAGIDEYEDVQFEGITVMNKKNSHNFLRTIYGPHYNEWLPPVKRISHHSWTTIDFGHYAQLYDLDKSYRDIMSTGYSFAKLKQMRVVSDMMIEKITGICDKHGLHYKLMEMTDEAMESSFPEIGEVWRGPDRIALPRRDYEQFGKICQEELGPKYEYQSHDTDPEYGFYYSKVRLNYTKFDDKRLRKMYANRMNDGFYVSILPLDECEMTPESAKIRKETRRWNRYMKQKWTKARFIDFVNLEFKRKLIALRLIGKTAEGIYAKIDSMAKTYDGKGCKYCYDSSGQSGTRVYEIADILGDKPLKVVNNRTFGARSVEEFVTAISREYGPCYLTYYDIPEYQLSVLRYDEQNDRFLTTEEIIASND